MVIRAVLAQFNPIKPKQLLDKYEGARIQFRAEYKSCLTQKVKLKRILKLNPNGNQGHVSRISPYLAL